MDKIQSLYQGRPVSLQYADIRVPIEFLDTYEEFESWRPFSYSSDTSDEQPDRSVHSVSTFVALCKLSVIMNDILNSIYAEGIFDQSPADLSKMLETLHLKLVNWHGDLAPHLKFDPLKSSLENPTPHGLSLM